MISTSKQLHSPALYIYPRSCLTLLFRVIPFLFIALLLEEVIPLIAIYAPFMLPSTCILPSQRERIQEKKTEKAIAFAEHHRSLLSQLEGKQDPPGHLPMQVLRSDDAALALCGFVIFPLLCRFFIHTLSYSDC